MGSAEDQISIFNPAEAPHIMLSTVNGNYATRFPTQSTETRRLDRPGAQARTGTQRTAPNGLYSIGYSVPAPKGGHSNLTFPMRIDAGQQRIGPRDAGTYFAQQFSLIDKHQNHLGSGYIGLQPREKGKALVMFSGSGSAFKAPQGRSGFDGGRGASNSTLVDFKFGNSYNLSVERNPGNSREFIGYIQDVTNWRAPGVKQEVKRLQVNKEAGLAESEGGFIEHYGARISQSRQIPRISGGFGAPYATHADGSKALGTLRGGAFYGRYMNALMGMQTDRRVAGRTTAVDIVFAGMR